uniref:F-type H+-transporting ATPase subunit delta n=1 Tax=Tetraselmis sp. GSL018 TaxID=582737 RepID=A0A061R2X3_9CHLO|mmetsp:Transcript_36397/g.86430  ORF Transcript_36397/g.86430 Transcript_36397/m.86430 type:complete len:214 (+) Transcript_36397:134-775(+)
MLCSRVRQCLHRSASYFVRELRSASAALEGQKSSTEMFTEKFKAVAPGVMEPPKFPGDYSKTKLSEVDPSAPMPGKVSFNFYLPHQVIHQNSEVDMVLLPATTGDFGIMPGHVPVVAQLRPGVVTVHKELDKEVERYFVSSGFAFVHPDSSADVCAVEAVPVDDLDPAAISSGLSDYSAKLASAQSKGDEYEAATAQIGVDVFSAMNSAVSAK